MARCCFGRSLQPQKGTPVPRAKLYQQQKRGQRRSKAGLMFAGGPDPKGTWGPVGEGTSSLASQPPLPNSLHNSLEEVKRQSQSPG